MPFSQRDGDHNWIWPKNCLSVVAEHCTVWTQSQGGSVSYNNMLH